MCMASSTVVVPSSTVVVPSSRFSSVMQCYAVYREVLGRYSELNLQLLKP